MEESMDDVVVPAPPATRKLNRLRRFKLNREPERAKPAPIRSPPGAGGDGDVASAPTSAATLELEHEERDGEPEGGSGDPEGRTLGSLRALRRLREASDDDDDGGGEGGGGGSREAGSEAEVDGGERDLAAGGEPEVDGGEGSLAADGAGEASVRAEYRDDEDELEEYFSRRLQEEERERSRKKKLEEMRSYALADPLGAEREGSDDERDEARDETDLASATQRALRAAAAGDALGGRPPGPRRGPAAAPPAPGLRSVFDALRGRREAAAASRAPARPSFEAVLAAAEAAVDGERRGAGGAARAVAPPVAALEIAEGEGGRDSADEPSPSTPTRGRGRVGLPDGDDELEIVEGDGDEALALPLVDVPSTLVKAGRRREDAGGTGGPAARNHGSDSSEEEEEEEESRGRWSAGGGRSGDASSSDLGSAEESEAGADGGESSSREGEEDAVEVDLEEDEVEEVVLFGSDDEGGLAFPPPPASASPLRPPLRDITDRLLAEEGRAGASGGRGKVGEGNDGASEETFGAAGPDDEASGAAGPDDEEISGADGDGGGPIATFARRGAASGRLSSPVDEARPEAGGGRPSAPRASLGQKIRRLFVEEEAVLSEDEDGLGGGLASGDEDEDAADADAAGELAGLVGVATGDEGAVEPEAARAAGADLHRRWEEQADERELRRIVQGLKSGFAGRRRRGDGLDDDADGAGAGGVRAGIRRRTDGEEGDGGGADGAADGLEADLAWLEHFGDAESDEEGHEGGAPGPRGTQGVQPGQLVAGLDDVELPGVLLRDDRAGGAGGVGGGAEALPLGATAAGRPSGHRPPAGESAAPLPHPTRGGRRRPGFAGGKRALGLSRPGARDGGTAGGSRSFVFKTAGSSTLGAGEGGSSAPIGEDDASRSGLGADEAAARGGAPIDFAGQFPPAASFSSAASAVGGPRPRASLVRGLRGAASQTSVDESSDAAAQAAVRNLAGWGARGWG